jgi:hypothetical protein
MISEAEFGSYQNGGLSASRLFDLEGRVAIVTGASSGLGEGVARVFAEAGAKVAVVARRVDRLEKLASDINGLALGFDLQEASALSQVIPKVVQSLGAPEILVNAAGNIFTHAPAENEPLEEIQNTFNLNLLAPFRLAQEVYPHMKENGRGSIINVSSISGHVGFSTVNQASYSASKMGLTGLTAQLAMQWARDSIRVNTIAPGFFHSEIADALYDDERGHAWLKKNTPLPRDGSVVDFLGAMLWLASDAGRYVTGQTIVIDGGWVSR